jgi:hypothetical protein
MSKRVRVRAVSAFLAIAMGATGAPSAAKASAPVTAAGAGHAPSSKAASHGVTLSASKKQVEEGDRFALSAVLKSPAKATRVTLQKWYVPSYYGDPTWQSVKTVGVNGRSKVTFRTVAADLNTARYRVVLSYTDSKAPIFSKPARVTIWRWIPLADYDPYYETSGLLFGEATINGIRYVGWGAAVYSHARAWEARFTPGRHCKTFRGVLGVGDVSDDGSSGTIKFTADDQVIYESSSLTPGMDLHVSVPLATPYRLGIQLFDTSPDGMESWPVIGEPELLCTGV